MANRTRHSRTISYRFSLLFIVAVLGLVTGCVKQDAAKVDTSGLAASAPDTGFALTTLVDEFCARQKWVEQCIAHEYPDLQRLNDGNGEYGPEVEAIPAEGLANRTAASFETVGEPVASVMVGSGGHLPQSYQLLNLVRGQNCVYLKKHASGAYDGYIIRADATGDPCKPRTSGSGPVLAVMAVLTPGFENTDNVPAVARFREGQRGNRPQPMLGIKCAERWCIIAPPQTDSLRVPHHGMNQSNRAWAVHGWGDAQHLAVKPIGSNVLRFGPEASIIAGPAAAYDDEDDFTGDLVHAASVHFRTDPGPNKYKNKWGFNIGRNEIWIRKPSGQTNTDNWVGEVRSFGGQCSANGCIKAVKVERDDHGFYVPPTARWMWLPDDEGAWVRCDDGCCKISPM